MSKVILSLRDPINLINNFTTNQVGIGALDASMGKTLYDRLNTGRLPFAYILYSSTTKVEALHMVDTPTEVFNNYVFPYCMIFQDVVGDSPYGGGIAAIFGMTYTAGDGYGAQLWVGPGGLYFRGQFDHKWNARKYLGGGAITT